MKVEVSSFILPFDLLTVLSVEKKKKKELNGQIKL